MSPNIAIVTKSGIMIPVAIVMPIHLFSFKEDDAAADNDHDDCDDDNEPRQSGYQMIYTSLMKTSQKIVVLRMTAASHETCTLLSPGGMAFPALSISLF